MEPVGKRFLVAVDVSTSLSSVVPGTSISTAVAAAAITMVRHTVWVIVNAVGTAVSEEKARVKELLC